MSLSPERRKQILAAKPRDLSQGPIFGEHNKAHVVVVENIVHQGPHQEPLPIESRYLRWLETTEQPYIRRLSITEQWVQLDCGWLTEASVLVIHNDEGKLAHVPSPEEAQTLRSRVIELAVEEEVKIPDLLPTGEDSREMRVLIPFGSIPPCESIRLLDPCLTKFRLRGRAGEKNPLRCTVHLIPR